MSHLAAVSPIATPAATDPGDTTGQPSAQERPKCDACAITLDETDSCPSCWVYHGEPCEACGRRGYHERTCRQLDEPGNDAAAYL